MGLYDKKVECGRGGIGRRAALRSLSGKPGGSSSLLDRTILQLNIRCMDSTHFAVFMMQIKRSNPV